jgi:hypothetical protein
MDLGEGWNHVVRGGGGVLSRPLPPPPLIKIPLSRSRRRPSSLKWRRPGIRPDLKPEPKSTAAPKPPAGKHMKKAAANVKTAAAALTTPNLVVQTRSSTSPLSEISDLDHLPLHACVELTRRFLTSSSFFPIGAARPRAVLKTVILFVAEYGSTP